MGMINLSSYLRKELIRLNQEILSKDEVLKFIAELLFEEGFVKHKEKVYEELKKREDIQSTGIGNGIAVPHFLSSLKEPLVGLITLQKAIDFQSIDKKPVNFLFFTAAPDPNLHLRMLARLARLVKATKIVRKIRKAKDIKEAYETFRQEEIKL